MEQAVVVLRPAPLVVLDCVAIVRVIVVIVQRIGGKTPRLDCRAEGFSAHFPARVARLLVDHAVLRLVLAEADVRVRCRRGEREALGRGAGGGVGDRQHGDDGAEDDGRGAGSGVGVYQGVVAALVVRFHGHGGEGEVGAVDGYDGGLSEARAGVEFLDRGVDGDEGD